MHVKLNGYSQNILVYFFISVKNLKKTDKVRITMKPKYLCLLCRLHEAGCQNQDKNFFKPGNGDTTSSKNRSPSKLSWLMMLAY